MSRENLEKLILPVFFRHQIYIKMFHFQTNKYGAHKASDSYLEKFSANMDRFTEVMQGICGQVQNESMTLQQFNFNEYRSINQMISKMNEFINWLKTLDNFVNGESSLLTIRDEMLADAQQFVYLLKFE